MTAPAQPAASPESLLASARALARRLAARAPQQDRTGAFAAENIADLVANGFAAMPVPVEYGGAGARLLDSVRVVEEIGRGDGSTALCFTMHIQTLGHAAEVRAWEPALFERICRAAVTEGALLNAVASEPELGSPSRGGRPRTTAVPLRNSTGEITAWRLNGHKSWASMSPALRWMIIPAAVDDAPKLGEESTARFLVPTGEGVEIVETWDAMGMRGTGSHDVFLHDVTLPADHMLSAGSESAAGKGALVNAWFSLTVSAVYVGVAQAAIDAAARFALQRVPTALGKPIAETESIQRRLGEADLAVQQARMVVHHVASRWDAEPEARRGLSHAVAIAKVTATNNAVTAVDHCMRVLGGASMMRDMPLERLYRDVRAGISHPINDDLAYLTLGRAAIAAARESLAAEEQERSIPATG
jgi:alkylation response protein AidB-like acyl-CoA dehydrogenase